MYIWLHIKITSAGILLDPMPRDYTLLISYKRGPASNQPITTNRKSHPPTSKAEISHLMILEFFGINGGDRRQSTNADNRFLGTRHPEQHKQGKTLYFAKNLFPTADYLIWVHDMMKDQAVWFESARLVSASKCEMDSGPVVYRSALIRLPSQGGNGRRLLFLHLEQTGQAKTYE